MSGTGAISRRYGQNAGNGNYRILGQQVSNDLLHRISKHDKLEMAAYVENVTPDNCPLCHQFHRKPAANNTDGTCRAVKACAKRQQENADDE